MELAELIRTRRSIRAFESRHVEAAKIRCILEMANLAPSAGNLQAFEIYQVEASHPRAALARAADQSFIAQAPLILVFMANTGRSARKYGARGRDLYAVQDATIAATYAMLAAADQGLSTVWIGAFDPGKVAAAVGSPHDWTPVAILPVGYAAESPLPTTRRPIHELVHPL